MNQPDLPPLHSKHHFETLDGLRGVAAISVVIFHFMEMAINGYEHIFIGNGFLAVDFFFCLSGFVIGYAYDDRIAKIGKAIFFTSRLIRLYPMVVFGSVLGLISFLFDPWPAQLASFGVGRIALIFGTSLLLIPFPVVGERGFNLFTLNAPAWSLFWEFIANIVYAFILCRLKRSWLIAIAVLSAIGLCYVTYKEGNICGGWSGGTFWDGGIRIAFSFTAGLLVYRFKWIIRSNIGFGLLSLLLALAFVMPFGSWNWITEPLVILFYFPLIIMLGAGARLKESAKRICRLFGNISYPLYMTHYAAIWIFGHYVTDHKVSSGQLALIVISGVLLLFGVAYGVMRWYDVPVRQYLTDRRKRVMPR